MCTCTHTRARDETASCVCAHRGYCNCDEFVFTTRKRSSTECTQAHPASPPASTRAFPFVCHFDLPPRVRAFPAHACVNPAHRAAHTINTQNFPMRPPRHRGAHCTCVHRISPCSAVDDDVECTAQTERHIAGTSSLVHCVVCARASAEEFAQFVVRAAPPRSVVDAFLPRPQVRCGCVCVSAARKFVPTRTSRRENERNEPHSTLIKYPYTWLIVLSYRAPV